MLLNVENSCNTALIYNPLPLAYADWWNICISFADYFSLVSLRQDWYSKKYGELCRSVFEIIKLDMSKKLNVADIF